MKRLVKLRNALALVSVFGLCFPAPGMVLHAGEPASGSATGQKAPAKLALDVVTNAARELRGTVVNPDGSPAAMAKVALRQATGKDALQTTTDESGRFMFQEVRPGVYGLTVSAQKARARENRACVGPGNRPAGRDAAGSHSPGESERCGPRTGARRRASSPPSSGWDQPLGLVSWRFRGSGWRCGDRRPGRCV